ncbi:hypothetical protein GOP47_0018593 [Adiantum capillus-veneris]|uniref:Uncharacterized protein n=1 Tax=Adiantum capillus-veneris TaxID=13818 RepID=A0A9D4UES4_ADICA|nr:hypothetical protein GOP47_0018593 [Adiantum capillus-veneris]
MEDHGPVQHPGYCAWCSCLPICDFIRLLFSPARRGELIPGTAVLPTASTDLLKAVPSITAAVDNGAVSHQLPAHETIDGGLNGSSVHNATDDIDTDFLGGEIPVLKTAESCISTVEARRERRHARGLVGGQLFENSDIIEDFLKREPLFRMYKRMFLKLPFSTSMLRRYMLSFSSDERNELHRRKIEMFSELIPAAGDGATDCNPRLVVYSDPNSSGPMRRNDRIVLPDVVIDALAIHYPCAAIALWKADQRQLEAGEGIGSTQAVSGQAATSSNLFNPLFEYVWLPWAKESQYYEHRDVGLLACEEMVIKGLHLRHAAIQAVSWAIPTLPVLHYMVQRAPDGRIVEIGSGMGYWALLLQQLGADVVAVDNMSDILNEQVANVYFLDTLVCDGAEFVKDGYAAGRALFLCWPHEPLFSNHKLETHCLAEHCLASYAGDTVFFVGEVGGYDGCTFNMTKWLQRNASNGWEIEMEIELPCWPLFHDTFLCCVKRSLPPAISSRPNLAAAPGNDHDLAANIKDKLEKLAPAVDALAEETSHPIGLVAASERANIAETDECKTPATELYEGEEIAHPTGHSDDIDHASEGAHEIALEEIHGEQKSKRSNLYNSSEVMRFASFSEAENEILKVLYSCTLTSVPSPAGTILRYSIRHTQAEVADAITSLPN